MLSQGMAPVFAGLAVVAWLLCPSDAIYQACFSRLVHTILSLFTVAALVREQQVSTLDAIRHE